MLIGIKVEKENPHRYGAHRYKPMGAIHGEVWRGTTILTHGFTNANPMPIKKAEPKLRMVFER